MNTEQVFHLIDIMPTLCELAGCRYPDTYKGREIRPSPGISMVPYFKNVNQPPVERTIFWQHETCSAVRRGNWKLVTTDDRDENMWELYDLSIDRSETENLIKEKSELARELRSLWRQWAEDSNVLPFPEERNLKAKKQPDLAACKL